MRCGPRSTLSIQGGGKEIFVRIYTARTRTYTGNKHSADSAAPTVTARARGNQIDTIVNTRQILGTGMRPPRLHHSTVFPWAREAFDARPAHGDCGGSAVRGSTYSERAGKTQDKSSLVLPWRRRLFEGVASG